MNKKYQRVAVLICLSACSLPACSDDSAVTDDSSKNGACTAADNICFDNSTAQICENGILYHKICAYGCENGACQDPPKCTAADNACQDEKTLSICDETAGIMKERECAFGCAGNACASGACTPADNICFDNNTAQTCENGALYREKCAHGCANGACQEPPKCTPADNACKDEKTLSICDEASGIMKERECANGCVNNACASGACTPADNICFANNTAQTCENGALYREKCAHGCANGACQEPPKCTPADNACKDEKILSICDETAGIMKERECEYGCAGNACALPCTAADNKCIDANTIQICKNGHISAKKCSDFGDSFVCATTNGIPDCREALGITFELTANAERDGILTFAPKVGKLDVVFNVDTTGLMDRAIYQIKANIGDVIENIRAIVPDSGFALSMFDDFPITACTRSDGSSATCGSSRTNSNYSDLPLRVLGQVSDDETTVIDYVNNSLFKIRNNGGDSSRSGVEALYQLMTKEGVKWRSDTSSDSWTSLSFPAMDADRWGGAGFRKDTLPVIIHISDAYSHDKPSYYNTSVKEWMAYKDGYIDTPHYTEHIVPKLKSTGTRIISLNFGYGERYKQMSVWSRESNAVVPVCAYKTEASAWMCGDHMCCAGEYTIDPYRNSQCFLYYKVPVTGNVTDYITQGIGALVKYGTFEVSAKVRGETMDNGKDTSCFIDYVEAYEYVAPTAAYEASCVPAAAPAMIQSESYNDGFKNFAIGSTANNQGAKLRFKVHAKNDGCYDSGKETKAFLAYIDVYDPITGLVFDTQHVTVTVPGSL